MNQDLENRFWDLMESDLEDPDIQYQVGCCHLYGEGTQQNGQEAQVWLAKAAAQGHLQAQALLNSVKPERAELGTVTQENLMDWCARAEDGDPEAQYQAALYFQKEGRSELDVYRYLEMAVAQGHPQACLALGLHIRDDDPEKAEKLFQNAADCGIPQAFTLLGEINARRGEEEKAAENFEHGAELSGGEAMLELAVRFALGDGVLESKGKAMSWLKRAKDAGISDAQARFQREMDLYRQRMEREEAARREEQWRQEEAYQAQRRQEEAILREREQQLAQERERRQEQMALQRGNEKRERLQSLASFARRNPVIAGIVALCLVCAIATIVGGMFHKTVSVVTRKSVDAFGEINVNFLGVAPFGKVDIINNSGYPSIQGAELTADPSTGLSNGDTVTVTVSSSDSAQEDDGIRVKQNRKTFTVTGLSSYVMEPSQIDEASMEAMTSQAGDMVETYLANTDAGTICDNLEVRRSYVYAMQKDFGTPELETSYLLTLKDGFSAKNVNLYYLIYKVQTKLTQNSKTVYDGNAYYAVLFSDLSQTPEGVTEVTLSMAELYKPVTSMEKIYTNCVSSLKDKFNVVEIPAE